MKKKVFKERNYNKEVREDTLKVTTKQDSIKDIKSNNKTASKSKRKRKTNTKPKSKKEK